MLESALGTDLARFGEYQTRLVKLNPKLGSQLGEEGAPAAPTTANTPAAAPLLTAPTGIPPPEQADATTPGAPLTHVWVAHLLALCILAQIAAPRAKSDQIT